MHQVVSFGFKRLLMQFTKQNYSKSIEKYLKSYTPNSIKLIGPLPIIGHIRKCRLLCINIKPWVQLSPWLPTPLCLPASCHHHHHHHHSNILISITIIIAPPTPIPLYDHHCHNRWHHCHHYNRYHYHNTATIAITASLCLQQFNVEKKTQDAVF